MVDSHSLNRSTERSRRSPPYNTGIPQSATQNLSPTSIGDPQSDANDVALKEDASPRPLRERDRVRGLSLKETFIGAKISEVKGEGYSATKVSYFKGNDPAKWKNNISTHDFVDLGDVYEGIGLRLKAYGNNVEKLFTVKPGANPEQIKIRLSGIRSPENPPPLSPSLMKGGGRKKISKRGEAPYLIFNAYFFASASSSTATSARNGMQAPTPSCIGPPLAFAPFSISNALRKREFALCTRSASP